MLVGGYKWRVLAGEGRKVKPINFGDVNKKPEVISRLKRKYWDSLPYYK